MLATGASQAQARGWSLAIWFIAAERRHNFSHGRKPVDGEFQRLPSPVGAAQPQICAAPTGLTRSRNSKPRAHARG